MGSFNYLNFENQWLLMQKYSLLYFYVSILFCFVYDIFANISIITFLGTLFGSMHSLCLGSYLSCSNYSYISQAK